MLLQYTTVCFSEVLRGVAKGGQQQFATQTLRVHLLGYRVQRMQKQGAEKSAGTKPHEETPNRKLFLFPLTSVRFAPPPLFYFSC